MSNLTDADKKAFIDKTIAGLTGNKTALVAAGWDPTPRLTNLTNGVATVSNGEAVISPIEVALKNAVDTAAASLRTTSAANSRKRFSRSKPFRRRLTVFQYHKSFALGRPNPMVGLLLASRAFCGNPAHSFLPRFNAITNMIRLEDITPGLALAGIESSVIGNVMSVNKIADGVVQVIYRTPDGSLKERLLNRADEAEISVATVERPWSFDGDGEVFKMVVEAKRIDLAFLLRSDDGGSHVECGTTAAPDHGRIRVPVASAAASIRAGRQSGRGENDHGGTLHPRTHHGTKGRNTTSPSCWSAKTTRPTASTTFCIRSKRTPDGVYPQ